MSILGRRVPPRTVAGMVAVLVVLALLPAATTPAVRDIHLVARNMAFYAEGDFEHPNPVIDVKVGETVRIILTNDDRGISHDFAVPAVSAASDLLRTNEVGEVVFESPAAPGSYPYQCNPHQLMMRGSLRVTQ